MSEAVRKFSLAMYDKGNKNNTRYEYTLNNIFKNGLLTEPDGLGLQNTVNYSKVSSKNIISDFQTELIPITCILSFLKYSQYNLFTKRIRNVNYKAELLYEIDIDGEKKEYKRDVVIENVSKSEKKLGTLSCNVTFNPTSFWFEDVEYDLNLVANEYTMELFTNDSEQDCEIEFMCSISNMNEFIFSISGNNFLRACKLKNLNQLEYKILRYSSNSNDYYLIVQPNNPTTELKQNILTEKFVDLEYAPLFQIPAKENVYLQFKADVATLVKLKIRKFYVSV